MDLLDYSKIMRLANYHKYTMNDNCVYLKPKDFCDFLNSGFCPSNPCLNTKETEIGAYYHKFKYNDFIFETRTDSMIFDL
jgi:hypothetical protein